MDLAKWLEVTNTSDDDFARAINICDSYMYALKTRRSKPGKHLRIVIEQHTDGLVTVDSWDK